MTRIFACRVFRWLPWLFFAYPALLTLLTRSSYPVLFGRYSLALVAMNLFNLLALAIFLWGEWRGKIWPRAFAYLMIFSFTLFSVANVSIEDAPGIQIAFVLTRLFLGLALCVLAWEKIQARKKAQMALLVALGLLPISISLYDLGVWIAKDLHARFQSAPRAKNSGEPTVVEKSRAQLVKAAAPGARYIPIVGDSIVWGQGVRPEEGFVEQLNQLFQKNKQNFQALKFAEIGFRLPDYIGFAQSIPDQPRSHRMVVGIYMNDLADSPYVSRWRKFLSYNLESASPSVFALRNYLLHYTNYTIDEYHQQMVRNFDPGDPSFAARWEAVRYELKLLANLAKEKTDHKPVLLIFPIMVDFNNYPLAKADQDFQDLGRELGFDIVDFYEVFAREKIDSVAHRPTPDDSHFDAPVHRLVAETLWKKLEELEAKGL